MNDSRTVSGRKDFSSVVPIARYQSINPEMSRDDIDELEDAPDEELEQIEEQLVDRASAARTIEELKIEIETLQTLEELALRVKQSGSDKNGKNSPQYCRVIRRCSMFMVPGEN